MLAIDRQELKDIMEQLEDKQKANKFTPEIYAGIADLLTQMNESKLKRYSYYKYVLQVMITFSDDPGLAGQHFNKWVAISRNVLKGIDGKASRFETYLKFSRQFWETGNLYDISKGSHKWRASSRVFTMDYENNVLSMEYNETDLVCYLSLIHI